MNVAALVATVGLLTAYACVWALCVAAKENDRTPNPPDERTTRVDQ